jgi:hypothetical protein
MWGTRMFFASLTLVRMNGNALGARRHAAATAASWSKASREARLDPVATAGHLPRHAARARYHDVLMPRLATAHGDRVHQALVTIGRALIRWRRLRGGLRTNARLKTADRGWCQRSVNAAMWSAMKVRSERGAVPVTDVNSSDSHAASPSAISPKAWALEVATASGTPARTIADRCSVGVLWRYSTV